MSKKTIKIIIVSVSAIILLLLLWIGISTFNIYKEIEPRYLKAIASNGDSYAEYYRQYYHSALYAFIMSVVMIIAIILSNILFLTKYRFCVLTEEQIFERKKQKIIIKQEKLKNKLNKIK